MKHYRGIILSIIFFLGPTACSAVHSQPMETNGLTSSPSPILSHQLTSTPTIELTAKVLTETASAWQAQMEANQTQNAIWEATSNFPNTQTAESKTQTALAPTFTPTLTPTPSQTPSPTATPTPLNLSRLVPITVQNVGDLKPILTLEQVGDLQATPLPYVRRMVFRQDKSALVSIHEGGILKVWDLHTGKEISHLSVSGKSVLSSDGRLVATGADDGKVTLWEVDTGNLLDSFEQINQQVGVLAFSQDSNLLVIIYQEQVVFWDLKSDVEPRIYPWNLQYLSKFVLTKDGRKMAVLVGVEQSEIQVWDTHTGNNLTIPGREKYDRVGSLAFHPEGQFLAVGNYWDGSIELYKPDSGTLLDILGKPERRYDYDLTARIILFNQDGNLMATQIDGGGTLVWNIVQRTSTRIQNTDPFLYIEYLRFSPDGSLLLAGGTRHIGPNAIIYVVIVWESATGAFLADLGKLDSIPSDHGTFNSEGTMLATSQRGTIWIWGIYR